MPWNNQLTDELAKSLMSADQFSTWQRQQKASREFWRTLRGPAQRPLGSNADEWHLFLSENKDALPFLAVQIAEAIEEAGERGVGEGFCRRVTQCVALV